MKIKLVYFDKVSYHIKTLIEKIIHTHIHIFLLFIVIVNIYSMNISKTKHLIKLFYIKTKNIHLIE